MNLVEAVQAMGQVSHDAYNVLGPVVEFLTSPNEANAGYCIMRGTIPAGLFVPLHSHPDAESMLVLSGVVEALAPENEVLQWRLMNQGDFLHLPAHAKHAWRNGSNAPVIQLIITTARLGGFFREVGKRGVPAGLEGPPEPQELARFVEVARRYHHWLGSEAENAAVGIRLG